jgi:Ran GTPase-activating protein (RanGAP) involved in mRNA processing and transport
VLVRQIFRLHEIFPALNAMQADKNEQGAGAEEPPTGVVTETGDDEAEEDEEEKERRLEERARQRAEVEVSTAALIF